MINHYHESAHIREKTGFGEREMYLQRVEIGEVFLRAEEEITRQVEYQG